MVQAGGRTAAGAARQAASLPPVLRPPARPRCQPSAQPCLGALPPANRALPPAHNHTLTTQMPGSDIVRSIYASIVDGHVAGAGLDEGVARLGPKLVDATIELHRMVGRARALGREHFVQGAASSRERAGWWGLRAAQRRGTRSGTLTSRQRQSPAPPIHP